MQRISPLLRWLRGNAVEVWAGLSLFIGIPVVITLYADYRAGLAWFFSMSVIIAGLNFRRS